MYLQIPGRQFEGCSLTADTHCAFSSNLFHRQIGPILLKSHRVWGWFVPKNLHFLISGPPSWRIAIWTICRWNRFEEKAQCEIGLKLRDHYDSWKCSRNAHNVVRQKHESSISRPTSFQSRGRAQFTGLSEPGGGGLTPPPPRFQQIRLHIRRFPEYFTIFIFLLAVPPYNLGVKRTGKT